MYNKARHLHSFGDTTVDEEEILEGFKVGNGFFSAKRPTPDAIRYVSQHAYQKKKKLDDAKSCGEDYETKGSSKRTFPRDHRVGNKSKIIWTKGLCKKFLEAIAIIGVDNASPKKILELMNVKGLTRDHVSSLLQKHRNLLKKVTNTSNGGQVDPKPCLLESSIVNGDSLKNSSVLLNQDQMNWSSYSRGLTTTPRMWNTESAYSPFLETANFNSKLSSALTLSSSLPNEGSVQTMINNLDEERNLVFDTARMGFINTSNLVVVHNMDGVFNDYGGCSTEARPFCNIEMGSSRGAHLSKELGMSWNQENPINAEYLSSSTFVENSNIYKNNYSTHSEFVKVGSFCCLEGNGNLEKELTEDELVFTESDIATLLSCADEQCDYGHSSNHQDVTLDPQYKDMNGQYIPSIVSYDSNFREKSASNNHQSLN